MGRTEAGGQAAGGVRGLTCVGEIGLVEGREEGEREWRFSGGREGNVESERQRERKVNCRR